jgi:hypothetical protein
VGDLAVVTADPSPARAVLVGDNRDRSNVGCRATSIALSELLEDSFAVTGSVGGGTVERPLRIGLASRVPGWDRAAKRAWRSGAAWNLGHLVPGPLRPDVAITTPRDLADLLLANRTDPAVAPLIDTIQDADLVVVNGEGDLIASDPPRRKLVFLLGLMEVAHRLGIPCAYVNAMVSDPPIGARNAQVLDAARDVLSRCSVVALRDRQSAALAQDLRLHASPQWVPDALFTWSRLPTMPVERVDPTLRTAWPHEDGVGLVLDAPYVCVSGSSAYGRGRRPPVSGFVELVRSLRSEGVHPVLVESAEADGFLRTVAQETSAPLVPWATNIHAIRAILGGAAAFVSGRHHPSILAALGGTRPVMFGSNSHKNTSLLALMGIEPATEEDAGLAADSVAALVDAALRAVSAPDSARADLRARCVELGDEAARLPTVLAAHDRVAG